MSEIKIFAVAGKPVLHSLSPKIFNFWFRAAGINAVYLCLAAHSAEDAVKTMKAMKLSGLNVTSPFKEKIIDFLDGTDGHAEKIGAVNVVVARGSRLWGFNTDFVGVRQAFRSHGVDPRGQRVAILGAGGAARAAAYGLKRSRAARVTIVNRTEENARRAAFGLGCTFAPFASAERVMRRSDLLVFGIPPNPDFFPLHLLTGRQIALQASYQDIASRKGIAAPANRIISGLDWLLYQAVPAFHRFTGRKVSLSLVKSVQACGWAEPPAAKPLIGLVGFMGSGKTTVGRLLAERLGWHFMDTDQEVEKSAGMTVPRIFKKKGEAFFREKERMVVETCIPAVRNTVVAFGGGAVLDPKIRSLIRRRCHVIWLWASLESALARIDTASRPLLDSGDPAGAAQRAFRIRRRAYAITSDLILNTEAATPQGSAGRIIYEMDQAFKD